MAGKGADGGRQSSSMHDDDAGSEEALRPSEPTEAAPSSSMREDAGSEEALRASEPAEAFQSSSAERRAVVTAAGFLSVGGLAWGLESQRRH